MAENEKVVDEGMDEIETALQGAGSVSDDMFNDHPAVVEEETVTEETPTDETPVVEEAPVVETPVVETPMVDDEVLLSKDAPEQGDWAKVREIAKGLKAKLKELESKPAIMVAPVVEHKVETPVEPQPSKISNGSVFLAAVKAEANELEEGHDPKQVISLAKGVIAKMSPADLLEVIEQVESGTFGDYGDDVRRMVTSTLPVSQARFAENERKERQASAQHQERIAKLQDSWNRVTTANPEMAKPESDVYKFSIKWMEENVGKLSADGSRFETTGPLVGLAQVENWPEVAYGIMINAYNAQQIPVLQQQLTSTKKVADDRREPSKSTGRPSASTTDNGADAAVKDIEDALRNAGTIGD